VKRGEIWTVAAGNDYAGKPRPATIVQDDRFDELESLTVCLFTTEPPVTPLFRLIVEPNAMNGLRLRCCLMVDKIMTVPKSKVGKRIGRLSDQDMASLNRAIVVFLGLAGPVRRN
jgi:mRNA interferase MazF